MYVLLTVDYFFFLSIDEVKVEYKSCLETRKYICEYKGGPSCPNGMFSLYGKCLGFVRNVANFEDSSSGPSAPGNNKVMFTN